MLCSLPQKFLSRIIIKHSWKDKTRTCLTTCNKSFVFSTINFNFWISKGTHDVFVLHYEKMKWFANSLVINFFNYNDHLQLITIQCISIGVNVIRQVTWIAMNAIHCMWNHINMWFVQFNHNYLGTTIV